MLTEAGITELLLSCKSSPTMPGSRTLLSPLHLRQPRIRARSFRLRRLSVQRSGVRPADDFPRRDLLQGLVERTTALHQREVERPIRDLPLRERLRRVL